MLKIATRYSPLPEAKPATGPAPAPAARAETYWGRQRALRAAARQAVLAEQKKLQGQFPNILVPAFKPDIGYREWAWREMKEGGLFRRMLEKEKATIGDRFRKVARFRHNHQQNNKAEHRLVASIPLREYYRARKVDKDFWNDNGNLRRYKRDNPEAVIRL